MVSNIVLFIVAVLGVPFLLYGAFFFVIGLFGLRKQPVYEKSEEKHRFAVVIAARNEGEVIGHLVDTLNQQNYPKDKYDVYVVPNNCTDDTEAQALAHGAKIYHCTRPVSSKGGALEQFFDHTLDCNDQYDAFCVFDADNLVDPEFLNGMNDAYANGARVAQGYRESKNPQDSWISGSQTVFYMIVNRFLNLARISVGLSAFLNGTGFMVSREALKDIGWHTFSLTEDIEFTTQNAIKGRKVFWVPAAITYDEHPLDFQTSWKQRKRWSTGVVQCFSMYFRPLWQQLKATKKIIYFDFILYLAAPFVQMLTFVYTIFSLIIMALLAVNMQIIPTDMLFSIAFAALGVIGCCFSVALIVKLERHKLSHIKTNTFFTFWAYLLSWIFINFDSVVNPITTWEPIAHTQNVSMSQMKLNDKKLNEQPA